MMTLIEKATVIHYHRHRLTNAPEGDVSALGWKDRDVQEKRFAALCTVGDLNNASVLDLGCGFGDFKSYLDKHFHGFSYVGVDCVAEFIALARRRHGNRPDCFFCQGDVAEQELPQADFVFASGLMSYRAADHGYYVRLIEKMYASAGRALSFNMLDARTFGEDALLTSHDPARIYAHCQSLSPRVVLREGYLANDFTIAMHREVQS